jgi:hypothetical protein
MKIPAYIPALSACLSLITFFSMQAVHAEKNRNPIYTVLAITPTDSLNKAGISWSAVDSTRVNKDKSIIFLYGKAKFTCPNFNLSADNKKTQKISATNFVIIDNLSKKETKGTFGRFSLNN